MLKTWLKPQWRVWFWLGFVNGAWIFAAWRYADRDTWFWITPVALSINCLFLAYDYLLGLRGVRGEALIGNDPWGILKTVHEIARELKLSTPPGVFIVPLDCAQLFVLGKTPGRAQIFITEGVIELLGERELHAVLTYQLLSIRARYHVLNFWATALLDFVYRAGKLLERLFAFVFGWSPPWARVVVTPVIWLLRLFLIDQHDFTRLDQETARHLESANELASALWKLHAYAQTRPWREAWTLAHMCIVCPLAAGPSTRRLQPALPDRMRRLVNRFPL